MSVCVCVCVCVSLCVSVCVSLSNICLEQFSFLANVMPFDKAAINSTSCVVQMGMCCDAAERSGTEKLLRLRTAHSGVVGSK